MNTAEAVILAIVEGLTEFIPVSSTGHLIIFSSLMGISNDDYTKLFEIAIQFGAILAVVVLYWKMFFKNDWKFYAKLIVAVIPALILGYLFEAKIDLLLQSPKIVAFLILSGGIVLLFIDNVFKMRDVDEEEGITYKKGFMIGVWQCLAMLPGVSRSAASIIGGMQQKLTRRLAAEFSFLLAVPTMAAATGYKLFIQKYTDIVTGQTQKGYQMVLGSSHNTMFFIIGNVIAFVVALFAVKFFIGFIQKHGFKYFGWYRIIAGFIMLIFAFFNIIR